MPTAKKNRHGQPYIVVKTKRGPRSRKISWEGWDWLSRQYPAMAKTLGDGIPVDYETYRELQRRNCILYRNRHRYSKTVIITPPPAPPKPYHPETVIVTPPPSSPEPLPPEAVIITPPPPSPRAPSEIMICGNCKSSISTLAIFCPRCGSRVGNSRDSSWSNGNGTPKQNSYSQNVGRIKHELSSATILFISLIVAIVIILFSI